jgi:alkyl hydroperoxide reductase subunit F
MYDLIIIGGGPAGLTATVYALRKRLNVLLITKDLGGKTNYRLQLPNIEHHLVINGEEVVNRFVNEIEYLDFARLIDKATKVERLDDGYQVTLASGPTPRSRALIVATGADAQKLGVPGEREFLMRGLCYSALSYAPLFIDRTCVVIGGAGLALRAAAELARIARQVTLVAPPGSDLDSALGRQLRAASNVVMLNGFQVERVLGDDFARVLSVRSGDGEAQELHADAFFVELGLAPNTDLVRGLVALDAQGRIEVDARNGTSLPGLFAAGDVTDAFAEQVLIAIGEGAKAALSAYEYLLEFAHIGAAQAATGEWR